MTDEKSHGDKARKAVGEQQDGSGNNIGEDTTVQLPTGQQNSNHEPDTTSVTEPVIIPAVEYLLDEDDTCTSCKQEKCGHESVCCMFCQMVFHAQCRDSTGKSVAQDSICGKTFYNQFATTLKDGNAANRPGNFKFICDPCMTSFEESRQVTQGDRVSILGKRVENLGSDVSDIKKMLSTLVEERQHNPVSSIAPTSLNPPTDSDNVLLPNVWQNRKQVENIRSFLLIDKSNPIEKAALSSVIADNGLQVHKTSVNKQGDTVVCLRDAGERTKLKETLVKSNPDIKLREPRVRHPHIAAVGVPKGFANEKQLEESFLKQNSAVAQHLSANKNSEFKVLKIKPTRNDENVFQAILTVSPDIRDIIRSHSNRLFVIDISCRVYDQYLVRRCNKCQGFGHYAKFCNDNPICGHCAQNGHDTNTCTLKTSPAKCINCKNNEHSADHMSHAATDPNCPSYIDQQNIMKRSMAAQHNLN